MSITWVRAKESRIASQRVASCKPTSCESTGIYFGSTIIQFIYQSPLSFVERTSICNFAENSTIYRCDSNLETVLKDLEHDMKTLLNWFKINSMKSNPKTFLFMILGRSSRLLAKLNINHIKIDYVPTLVTSFMLWEE